MNNNNEIIEKSHRKYTTVINRTLTITLSFIDYFVRKTINLSDIDITMWSDCYSTMTPKIDPKHISSVEPSPHPTSRGGNS